MKLKLIINSIPYNGFLSRIQTCAKLNYNALNLANLAIRDIKFFAKIFLNPARDWFFEIAFVRDVSTVLVQIFEGRIFRCFRG